MCPPTQRETFWVENLNPMGENWCYLLYICKKKGNTGITRISNTLIASIPNITDFITNSLFVWLTMAMEEETCCVSVQFRVLSQVPETWGRRVRHVTSSPAAAHTGLQAVLVAGSALEGFERIREAVAKYGHLAAVARWARDEGVAPTGLARLGMLYPL